MTTHSDPNYRQGEAYEYGDLREITLNVDIASDNAILWSCTYKKVKE